MQHREVKREYGFTLIEMIVTIALFTVIGLGIVALFGNLFTAASKQNSLTANQDSARKLVGQMVTQLRNSVAGADGSFPLEQASDQQVIFHANGDSDSSIERIRYFLQNGQLWEGLTDYASSTYPTSTERTYLLMNNVANSSTTPVFYYYDGTYSGSSTQSSLVQPVNVTQVTFVKINLKIYNTGGLQNKGTYSVSAGAAIRSLKTNLGN